MGEVRGLLGGNRGDEFVLSLVINHDGVYDLFRLIIDARCDVDVEIVRQILRDGGDFVALGADKQCTVDSLCPSFLVNDAVIHPTGQITQFGILLRFSFALRHFRIGTGFEPVLFNMQKCFFSPGF